MPLIPLIYSLIVHSTKLLNFDWSRAVGVPIKFPWKRRVREKMADSRFAILMALFLPNR